MFIDFREEEGGEKEREKHWSVASPTHPEYPNAT